MSKTASALGNGVKAVVPQEIEHYRSHNGKIRWGIVITEGRTILGLSLTLPLHRC